MTSSSRALMTFRFEKGSCTICLVRELLEHRSVATTEKYLGVNYADARAAVEGMALEFQPCRNTFVGFTQI